MPAKSKAQQKLMAMALAHKKGTLKNASPAVKKLANSMSQKELEKYANTERKGLPAKIGESVFNTNNKSIKRIISETVREVLEEVDFNRKEQQQPVFSSDQKNDFFEAIRKFNEYGNDIYRKSRLGESYKQIKNIVEFASQHLVEESGEWFDNVTASRHSKRLKESLKVFEKTVTEVMKLQQRLESAYEDIGETLNKYYEIQENKLNKKQSIREGKRGLNEDTRAIDFWNKVVDDLDTQFKSFDSKRIADIHKVSKYLIQKMRQIPQNDAMSIATSYGDYRQGRMDKDAFVKFVVGKMEKYRKNESVQLK